MKTLVLYHAKCLDGFAAMLAFQRLMGTAIGKEPDYVAAEYGQDYTGLCSKYTNAYILDFSLPTEQLAQILRGGVLVNIIDHHQSLKEQMQTDQFKSLINDGLTVICDTSKSGCQLVYHIYGNENHPMPWWVYHIGQGDLWNFEEPATKSVRAYFQSLPHSVPAWLEAIHAGFEHAVSAGSAMLSLQASLTQQMAERAEPWRMHKWNNGREAITFVTCEATCLFSEVAAALYKDTRFAVIWHFDVKAAKYKYSLRSTRALKIRWIAEHFGGGGHEQAAGFHSHAKPWDVAAQIAALAPPDTSRMA